MKRHPRPAAGFTLLEVLVALVLLATAVVIVLQLFSSGLRSIHASEDLAFASLKAETKMAEVLEDAGLDEKTWDETTEERLPVRCSRDGGTQGKNGEPDRKDARGGSEGPLDDRGKGTGPDASGDESRRQAQNEPDGRGTVMPGQMDMRQRRAHTERGFTLLELLITMVVLLLIIVFAAGALSLGSRSVATRRCTDGVPRAAPDEPLDDTGTD